MLEAKMLREGNTRMACACRGSYFGKSSLCGEGGTVRETEMDGTVYERMVGCTFSVVELAHVLSGS
jgi:hypothetical protein